MTEQQACTLCGAGGHTAAQCAQEERKAYEAHWRRVQGNTFYCESTWRGWQARATLARVAELEKQEPAGVVRKNEAGQVYIEWLDQFGTDMLKRIGMKLYAAPAAQAGQVPEGFVLIQRQLLDSRPLGVPGFKEWNDRIGEALTASPAQGGSSDE